MSAPYIRKKVTAARELPESFWLDHIAATFVETVRWWVDNKMKISPAEAWEYSKSYLKLD